MRNLLEFLIGKSTIAIPEISNSNGEEEMSLSCENERLLTSNRLASEESHLENIRKIDKPKNDPVNHPHHYTNSLATCECGKSIECIDVTRHYDFNIGNAIKYLWRCDLKGNSIQDLEKAIWYIKDEIQKRGLK